uniref:Aldehyde dehydrogenase family protein n=1 Tax=Philasterides dicentrarchi TaxID=282688 RepID=A0A481XV91_9CILI|nr:aldehyde dehydrogenase family protein [Philasterides dicentrarchi]
MAAQRVVQAKFANLWQTCIAPDYMFVHQDIYEELMSNFKKTILNFYTDSPQNSQEITRIISPTHTERLISLLQNSQGNILMGGKNFNIQEKYLEPTIIENPDPNSDLMKEEIFGPILPVYKFNRIQEPIEFINQREKPLALYYYGNNKHNLSQIENETSSGAFSTNECMYYLLNSHVPFGGVGASGLGYLHGLHGFNSCSHLKTVFYGQKYNGSLVNMRYPPLTKKNAELINQTLKYGNFYIKQFPKKVAGIVSACVLIGYIRKIKNN